MKGLWRIYVDDADSRNKLLTKGFALRGKSVILYASNPKRPYMEEDGTTFIRVKNVPLSADDGQIKRAFTIRECGEIVTMFREKITYKLRKWRSHRGHSRLERTTTYTHGDRTI